MTTSFKYGIISETKPGFAKVYFEEDDLVTDFWPVLQRTSLTDKESWPLNLKEHVVCLTDTRCEEGVILGAIYNETDMEDPGAADGKFRMLFADGTYIEYDKTLHKLTANITGGVNVVIDEHLLVEKDGDTLKQALTLIVEAVQPIVVIYGNNPIYSKLSEALTKINNLLS